MNLANLGVMHHLFLVHHLESDLNRKHSKMYVLFPDGEISEKMGGSKQQRSVLPHEESARWCQILS
jgi:hypothetical protein